MDSYINTNNTNTSPSKKRKRSIKKQDPPVPDIINVNMKSGKQKGKGGGKQAQDSRQGQGQGQRFPPNNNQLSGSGNKSRKRKGSQQIQIDEPQIKLPLYERKPVDPVIVRSTATECPLCSYHSEYCGNVARHFQAMHMPELQQILTGQAVFAGFSVKEMSEKETQKLLQALPKKIAAAQIAAASAARRRKNRTPVPPILIRSTVPKCPLCNYASAFYGNVARHFQIIHKSEFQQVMADRIAFAGISKKKPGQTRQKQTPYTNSNQLPNDHKPVFPTIPFDGQGGIQDCLPQPQTSSGANKTNTGARRRPLAPPVLIRATVSQCPLCSYHSEYCGNVARHFQSKHKSECDKVLQGKAAYQGFSKKDSERVQESEPQQELLDLNKPVFLPTPNNPTSNPNPMPTPTSSSIHSNAQDFGHHVWTDKMVYPGLNIQNPGHGHGHGHGHQAPVPAYYYSGQLPDQKSVFLPPSSLAPMHSQESIQDYLLQPKVAPSQFQCQSSLPNKSQSCGVCVKSSSFIADVNQENSINNNNNIAFNDINQKLPSTLFRCPVSNCDFTTDSPYSVMVHQNFHQIMECMPPFYKTVVEASGTLDHVMRMDVEQPLESLSTYFTLGTFLEE